MTIRPLHTIEEFRRVLELEKAIWGYEDSDDAVGIPVFEKRGFLGGTPEEGAGQDGGSGRPRERRTEGTATLGGRPAEGHIVFFYRAPDTVGRPLARSSPISGSGSRPRAA